jgi:DNA-binding NarL/FixJ family response regulator
MERTEALKQLKALQDQISKLEADIIKLQRRCRDMVAKHGLQPRPNPHQAHNLGLSQRQLDVVQELAKGKSNQQIADTLFISEKTVKFHLTDIFKTLQVKSRTELLHLLHTDISLRNIVFQRGAYRLGNA